uniref:Snurportin-1 n=1 Tax=Rhabditophanes sp. KR3021 TaxID=114890 RepID=A0AC35TN13_9BILA
MLRELGNRDEMIENDEDCEEVKLNPFNPKTAHKYYLMYSEWLVDIPTDFSTKWLMKPCPKGKRQLVVCRYGITSCYTKSGFKINQFSSKLPGGSAATSDSMTVLDCIYVKSLKTYYILDCVSWDDQDFSEGEFSLRQYWLNSKFSENKSFGQSSKKFPFKFANIESVPCTKGEMEKCMASSFEYELDGLLFYYQDVNYERGQTPFVGWLLPWMLPDMLDVQVPDVYKKPENSMEENNIKEFIDEYNTKRDYTGSIKKTTSKNADEMT